MKNVAYLFSTRKFKRNNLCDLEKKLLSSARSFRNPSQIKSANSASVGTSLNNEAIPSAFPAAA